MPSDEAFAEYHPEQVILLLTEVYGLVSGPACWRRSLLKILVKELGYRVNVYDRCVLRLILEVDDAPEAGDEAHPRRCWSSRRSISLARLFRCRR